LPSRLSRSLAATSPGEFSNEWNENGVGCAVCIAVNLEDFPGVLALAEAHPNLYATVGVHPEYADAEEPGEQILALNSLAEHPKVVAVGETGLDYYWQKDRPKWQRDRFRRHIRAAVGAGKPLVVHMRDAAEDSLAHTRRRRAPKRSVESCTVSPKAGKSPDRALDLGFFISFSGIVTFKNCDLQSRKWPRRRRSTGFLLETDSPYLAPGTSSRQAQRTSLRPARRRGGGALALPVARADRRGHNRAIFSISSNTPCGRHTTMKKTTSRHGARRLRIAPRMASAATYDDLISAARLGDTKDIAKLVQRGASVDTTDKEGNTLLMLAARDGHTELVEYLIKQRAKVNERNAVGDTALRLAAFRVDTSRRPSCWSPAVPK
jgi:TatD DNase family protein